MLRPPKPQTRGFTLVELTVVMIVLGILAVVALPRMNTNDYRAAQFRDQTLAALRYAQKMSVSHNRTVCVTFPNNNSLQLTIALAQGNVVYNADLPLPGTNNNTLNSPDNNVTYIPQPNNFVFTPTGNVAANQVITIAGAAAAINVIGATGHVQ